jgi:hypothetical protein
MNFSKFSNTFEVFVKFLVSVGNVFHSQV